MDYYKILNEDENHFGIQYKTGLNVDVLPFIPEGDCHKGGIYFSREDILAFIDYGPWIRKVTIPEDAEVYENPGKPKKWKADKIILGERRRINTGVIKELIEEGADPMAGDGYPLIWAAENGHTEILELLIPLVTDPKYYTRALSAAAFVYEEEYLEEVKLLLPFSDPKWNNSSALRWAAAGGHMEMVKTLLPFSDPKASESQALRWAVGNGDLDIVELLLPVSDPKAKNSEALRIASENGYTEIAEMIDQYIKENNLE